MQLLASPSFGRKVQPMDAFVTQSLPILFGGIISAAVGLGGAWFAFRLQRTAQRVDRVDAAAAALMLALGDYEDGLNLQKQWGKFGANRAEPFPVTPSRNTVSIRVNLLVMAARGDDRVVATRIRHAWFQVVKAKGDAIGAIGVLAGAIGAWRAGDKAAEVTEHIELAEDLASDGMGAA
jgi:hypothetical protein